MSKPFGRIHLAVDNERMTKYFGCYVTWCGISKTKLLRVTTQPIVADCKACLKAYDKRALRETKNDGK